jgi:hypothetical protein
VSTIKILTIGIQGPPGVDALPIGGTTGQPLAKLSDANLDADWANRVVLDSLRIRTTPNETVTPQAGTLYWDDLDQALAYQVNGNVLVDIAQENLVYVRNPPGGTTLAKGTAVCVLGAAANRLTVQRTDATVGGQACRSLGIVLENIPSPGFGFVSTFGLVRGFNTGNVTTSVQFPMQEGAELFASTTPGVLSTVPAAPPNRRVTYGYVVTTGVQGSVFVTIRRGLRVQELDNVAESGFTTGDYIKFDGSVFQPAGDVVETNDARLTDSRTPVAHGNEAHTSSFVDAAGAAAAAPVQSVNTKTGVVSLAATDLSDVQGTGWVANDLLRFDGSIFKPVRITADME